MKNWYYSIVGLSITFRESLKTMKVSWVCDVEFRSMQACSSSPTSGSCLIGLPDRFFVYPSDLCNQANLLLSDYQKRVKTMLKPRVGLLSKIQFFCSISIIIWLGRAEAIGLAILIEIIDMASKDTVRVNKNPAAPSSLKRKLDVKDGSAVKRSRSDKYNIESTLDPEADYDNTTTKQT